MRSGERLATDKRQSSVNGAEKRSLHTALLSGCTGEGEDAEGGLLPGLSLAGESKIEQSNDENTEIEAGRVTFKGYGPGDASAAGASGSTPSWRDPYPALPATTDPAIAGACGTHSHAVEMQYQ